MCFLTSRMHSLVHQANKIRPPDISLIFLSFVDLSGLASRQTRYFLPFRTRYWLCLCRAGRQFVHLFLVLNRAVNADSAPSTVAPLSLARISTYYAGSAEQLRAPAISCNKENFRELKENNTLLVAVSSQLRRCSKSRRRRPKA